VPLFSKVNTHPTFSPSAIFPKLCSYSLKNILAVSDDEDCCVAWLVVLPQEMQNIMIRKDPLKRL
jgi:hypothetical protein